MSRRFVLLDRDGTLVEEQHYLADPDQVRLLPGAAQGLRQLRQLGMGLVVITNQSGVGRGFFPRTQVERVHQYLGELLEAEEVRLDGVYFCPHTPADDCGCRKPKTGLVKQASRELGFDPQECLVIGDRDCDVELGRNLGAVTILVRTGYGKDTEMRRAVVPDYAIDDLGEVFPIASRWGHPNSSFG